ncbi:serine-threonine protein kinase, plant-type, putative [Ricinus communis]|uniref:non-specific serine/threonine protein kinase n=1 Tax=Ricinus communis TaxID=3988 RepID=B9SS83_RICCO|nr:serine-threonine protein kinase, plant-type, putative [Ricinus communis]
MGLSCRSCLSLSLPSFCSLLLAVLHLLPFTILPATFAIRNANNQTDRIALQEFKSERNFKITIGNNHLGSGRAEDLKFLSDLTNATALRILDMSMNDFGGKLDQHVANLSQKLETIFIDSNKIYGNIPAGIEVLVNLNVFDASNNKLSGTIPSSIGKLKNLQGIYLEKNNFSGSIPSSLGNLTSLAEILLSYNHLQGVIPSSLANCTTLVTLDLSNNNLTGSIPQKIFGMPSLSKDLDLSHNQFYGSLPNEVGNLKHLGSLALDHNILSGEIPSGLGSCASLERLDMNHNLFHGSIPSSLSSLRGIRKLNLSHNNLSGKIPMSLTGFSSEVRLDMSYNDLAGMVPIEGIFKNASAISLEGNTNLCGGIRALGLPACTSQQQKRRLSVKLKIIVSVVSVIIGAGLVLACLFLWRSRKSKGDATSSSFEKELLRLSYQSLLKATNGFSSDNLIGSGGFGSVYKGILDQDGLRLNIAIDVACALEYLHYHSGTPIVHCDLKPSNVLLDGEMTGHVSDFGLVKFLQDGKIDFSANHSSSVEARGTIGYCPPEYGLGSNISTSGDIFSFGILLLEMFTGKRPTDEMFTEGLSLHNFVNRALPEQVIKIIDPNMLGMQLSEDATSNHHRNLMNRRKDKLMECLTPIFEIGLSCSTESPQERMKIGDVVAQLSSVRNRFLGTRLPRQREVSRTLQ